MAAQRQMRIGAFITPTGHHAASWRHAKANPAGAHDLGYFVDLARRAEAAKLDMFFLGDVPGGNDPSAVGPALAPFQQGQGSFEPVTLLCALAAVTSHIGLVATASTTYEDPYLLARKFASLDWLSNGRAGWNVVTTGVDTSANFGLAAHPPHAERYERAREFVALTKQLWDSYEDDALVHDKASGVVVDPAKVHLANHVGKHFRVRGPLNVARPPQGWPVLIQAGASNDGRDFAASIAEAIFTAGRDLAGGQEFYADVKARARRHGRRAEDIVIMPGICPVIGGTEAEAQAKHDEIQALTPEPLVWQIVGTHYEGHDFTGMSLDDPAPPLTGDTNLNRGRHVMVADYIEREKPTLRQLCQVLAAARGHHVVVGTPEQVADRMEQWFTRGAADGFNLMAPVIPAGYDDFLAEVVPLLQRRGLFRSEYEGATLRENLGLSRPGNSYLE